ncbi:MAG: NADP-dependent oxidoreductase, partial [Cyanobacteria bacterium]|nr:NADP-dependent oxidoreductase [Cyanobacteriota bacterium]
MTLTTLTNRQYLLKTRPEGLVDDSTFELVSQPVPSPKDGEFVLKNLFLSIDPTNRIWVSDREQYMPPVKIGEVMRGLGIGRVVESKNPSFQVGQLVTGLIGWQDYMHCTGGESWPFSAMPKDSPLSPEIIVGAAGMTGLTAYIGVNKILRPKEGETTVISGAAGAVGSVAGQIAKIKGSRVVGIAGSDDKCRWIKDELGFDEA